jgi:tetratricopeptide (TPR) repeat protein
MKRALLICCLMSGLGSLYGGPTEDALAAGIAQHDRVLAYLDKGSRIPPEEIRRGRELLEPLASSSPTAKAYLGSLITLEASETSRSNPVKSLAQLSEGLGLVDEALAEKPEDMTIRMLRIINSTKVGETSPVKQWNKVAEDIRWFHGIWSRLDPSFKADVSLYEGIYNIKTGEIETALDAFDRCIELAPNTPSAKTAAQYLSRYGE